MKVAFYHGNQFAFETTFKDKEEFRSHLRLMLLTNESDNVKLKFCITRETSFGNSSGHECSVYSSCTTLKLNTNQGLTYYLKNVFDVNDCEFFQQNVGKLVEFNYEGKTRFLKVRKECDAYLEGNDATVSDDDESYRKFIKHKISNLKVLAELEC